MSAGIYSASRDMKQLNTELRRNGEHREKEQHRSEITVLIAVAPIA